MTYPGQEPAQGASTSTETPERPITGSRDDRTSAAVSEAIVDDDEETLRDRLEDLLPRDMVIWGDDDELAAFPWTLRKWLDVLGHEKAHPGCCKACGCATTCMAGAFYTSTVTSVLRELDKLGALCEPTREREGITP
jgi:hypothetical protein